MSNQIQTLQEYIRNINNQNQSCFKLTDDVAHWATYDVYTPEQLEHYLAVGTYWDLYKDVYGVRPRDFYSELQSLSLDEINKLNDDLYDRLADSIAEEQEIDRFLAEQEAWDCRIDRECFDRLHDDCIRDEKSESQAMKTAWQYQEEYDHG